MTNLLELQQANGHAAPLCTTMAAGRLVRRRGAPPAPFSRTRRTVGVLAVFLVSGITHEALFW